jgi:outer membrane protein assembly factor BamB
MTSRHATGSWTAFASALIAGIGSGLFLAAATAEAADAWPMPRGDSAQSGVAHARLGDKLALKWRLKLDGPVKATPILVDGKAFVGTMEGTFFAVDLKTTAILWKFSTLQGPLPRNARPNEKKFADSIEASACFVNDRLYVGAHDGNFYCLDARTGKMIWSFETADKITAAASWVKSPRGDAVWMLVGSNDNKLYCLDASTGTKIWEYETGNIINGAPAVANGRTIFGGCDGLVHVVNVADGKKIAEVEVKDYIAATAALDGDRAYVGHHGNKFICVDLKERTIAWQYGPRDFPYMASAALAKETVIVGGHDRRVHAITRDAGKKAWEFRTRGQINCSPVIVGQRVLIGSDDGNLYMLNLADGSEVWSYEIGQPIVSSPAVIDGLVVIGCDDGHLYAFGG